MNRRQGALLRALLDAADYKTSNDYARELGCSDRTVRTDVKALNAFFEREGFSTRVDRQRGAGLRLSLAPGEENRLARLLGESEVEMHPRYERLAQEMIALTCYPGPHTADSLARRMFRNKQQVNADLRWWQGVLAVSGLSLSPGRAIAVEGPEWTVRGFVMSMLFSFPTTAVRRRIIPSLLGSMSPYDRQFLERCIDEMERDLGFEFSSNAQWQFGVYLCIMIVRIKLGHSLAHWRDDGPPGPFFSYLRRRLERHFSITVSEAEMGLLRDMANCCTWQWSLSAMEAYEPSERARRIVDDIAAALADAFGQPVPEDMRKPLAILLESGLARRSCELLAPNPNEEVVKYEAMDGAALLSSVLCEVPSLVDADLFSPDYTRLVLVLLDYLEDSGAMRCYRVGLVVNCGIDLALWGAHRIEKLSSRLSVADVLTENEVQAACAAPGAPLHERFDFLVSFEPLDIDFPSVTISPAVSRADIDHIVASVPLWHRGREVRAPWERRALSCPPTPDGLFRALHGALEADGMLSMDFERFQWLAWTLSLVRHRTLVLVWCGPGAASTAMRIYQLEDGPELEAAGCTMAAVLTVRPEDKGNLMPLAQRFKRLVEDYADTSDLVSDDGFFVCFPE